VEAPPPPAPVVQPPEPIKPAPTVVPPVVVKQPIYHTEKLWHQLDELAQQIDTTNSRPKISVGSVAGMTTTLLSVGYVIWCLRGGSLVAMLLTTLPLWRWLDPLPVLDRHDRDRKDKQNDEDEERLQSMMD
jgi:hypothetical protein